MTSSHTIQLGAKEILKIQIKIVSLRIEKYKKVRCGATKINRNNELISDALMIVL